MLSVDKINGVIPIDKGGTGASTIVDGANNLRAYGFEKFTGNLEISSSNTKVSTITMTTHGRPIFMCVAGDWNALVSSAWIHIQLKIDGTRVASQIVHEAANVSANKPFCRTFMSIPSAGSHTFTAELAIGAGSGSLGEEGELQSPCFTVFEI